MPVIKTTLASNTRFIRGSYFEQMPNLIIDFLHTPHEIVHIVESVVIRFADHQAEKNPIFH